MIKGIADLDYNDSKKLISAIIERAKYEEEALLAESEEKKIEILMHEYEKRLGEDRHGQIEKDRAIETCNKRMEEIEDELFKLTDKKSYFEVQLDMLGEERTL